MIKAIVFDCFGVIVGKGFEYTYASAGGDSTKDQLFIAQVLSQANLGSITDRQFKQVIAEKLDISLEQWLAAETAAELADTELLEFIKSLRIKYKTAILSNANKGILSQKIGSQWLEACFDEVIASADVGLVKPDPEIYKMLAKRLGVQPEECVFIDDHQIFLDVGLSLGMKTILYRDFKQFKQELNDLLS